MKDIVHSRGSWRSNRMPRRPCATVRKCASRIHSSKRTSRSYFAPCNCPHDDDDEDNDVDVDDDVDVDADDDDVGNGSGRWK